MFAQKYDRVTEKFMSTFSEQIAEQSREKKLTNVALKCAEDKIFGNKTRPLFLRKTRSKEMWNSWLTFRSEYFLLTASRCSP
jgi:hypothetical protein